MLEEPAAITALGAEAFFAGSLPVTFIHTLIGPLVEDLEG
jgi:hypothetical protein